MNLNLKQPVESTQKGKAEGQSYIKLTFNS